MWCCYAAGNYSNFMIPYSSSSNNMAEAMLRLALSAVHVVAANGHVLKWYDQVESNQRICNFRKYVYTPVGIQNAKLWGICMLSACAQVRIVSF
jgi:hypothetical protein